MAANQSSISKTNSPQQVGKFCDRHDFSYFDDSNTPDVEFHVSAAIPIEPDLLSDIEELAGNEEKSGNAGQSLALISSSLSISALSKGDILTLLERDISTLG